MISIIICSRYSSLSQELQSNIHATIGGCEYELVHIDNSENKYNIFEAYNLGVRKAQGDILCFMHEDILFHSKDWGGKMARWLANDEYGIMGVAGGYAVLAQSDWRLYGKCLVNLIQGYNTIEENCKYYVFPNSSRKAKRKLKEPVEVAALDGVWFCIRKELFDKISFDEITYDGFHMYDTDICMQIHKLGKKVMICPDVLLEHLSVGSYTPAFVTGLSAFHAKWKDYLPVIKTITLTDEQIEALHQRGESRLKEYIILDGVKNGLKQLFSEKAKGLPIRPFTDKEKSVMKKSKYTYCKATIKNRNLSFSEVYRSVRPYLMDHYCPNKHKIVLKFIWYRTMIGLKRRTYD